MDHVTFRNIVSPSPERASSPVELQGFDADHAIHGVTLNGVVVAGQPLRTSDVKQNAFVDGVSVTP